MRLLQLPKRIATVIQRIDSIAVQLDSLHRIISNIAELQRRRPAFELPCYVTVDDGMFVSGTDVKLLSPGGRRTFDIQPQRPYPNGSRVEVPYPFVIISVAVGNILQHATPYIATRALLLTNNVLVGYRITIDVEWPARVS